MLCKHILCIDGKLWEEKLVQILCWLLDVQSLCKPKPGPESVQEVCNLFGPFPCGRPEYPPCSLAISRVCKYGREVALPGAVRLLVWAVIWCRSVCPASLAWRVVGAWTAGGAFCGGRGVLGNQKDCNRILARPAAVECSPSRGARARPAPAWAHGRALWRSWWTGLTLEGTATRSLHVAAQEEISLRL